MSAHHGQRGLELVTGVVEELALCGERRLEPVEHVVDGSGQRRDVVVAALRDPAGQITGGDVTRSLLKSVERAEQSSGLEAGHHGDDPE
jgi:hypothetical protein